MNKDANRTLKNKDTSIVSKSRYFVSAFIGVYNQGGRKQ
jgi:hypothetical protein